MTTRPKRKYTFGLISRLSLIIAFVGLGSWAVFSSRFKEKEGQEIAKHDGENGKKTPPAEASVQNQQHQKSSGFEPGGLNALAAVKTKTMPATFVEKKKPPKIKISKGRKQEDKKNKSFSLGDSGKKNPALPESKSFSPVNKGGPKTGKQSATGFTPPGSKSFSVQSNPTGPGSSTFNPATGFDPGKDKAETTSPGSAPKGAPPSSTFDPAENNPGVTPGNSPLTKTNPGETKTALSMKGKNSASTGENSTALNPAQPLPSTFDPGARSEFNPGANSKSNGQAASSPSSTFNPESSLDKNSRGSLELREVPKPTGNAPLVESAASGFQAKSSKGNEKPLREGGLPTKELPSQDQPGSDFSLGGGKQPASPSKGLSLEPSPPRSSANFSGDSPFQDKGSKPLSQKHPVDLGGGKGKVKKGSSSTGFGDISHRKKNSSTSLDPASVNKGTGIDGNPAKTGNPLSPTQNPAKIPGSQPGTTLSSNPNSTPSATAPVTEAVSSHPELLGNPQSGVSDNKPGPASLEGIQTPVVTLQKVLPREVQVGVKAEFRLLVRNVGHVSATNLTIVDPVPAGTQFINADPGPSKRAADGSLVWKIGLLKPNQQKIISVFLTPQQQGEIGSVARMSFQAAATAKTICTKPDIVLTHKGPQKVLINGNAQFFVNVKNSGDGVARNVILEDEIPEGFAFGNGKGKRLAYEIGNLAPGDSRNVLLDLKAVSQGKYVNEIRVKMAKTIAATHKLSVEVVAPVLEMQVTGPTRRYIRREAVYRVEIQNTGTAVAKNVLMKTKLPRGMKFIATNNRGQYNSREHAVYWSLVELSPQNKGAVELKLLPMGTGSQEIEFEARSAIAVAKPRKFPVLVDQLAELFFEVDDRDDPIEVNGETEYRVRVVNQGSKAATAVKVNIEMPSGIQAIKSTGPSKGTIKGQKIAFAPIPTLAPRGELIYKIQARGLRDGDHLIKVMLSSHERRETVAKQESTKVYSEFR